MAVLNLLFWVSLAILFYTYAGYAMLLYLYNNISKMLKPTPAEQVVFEPTVTLIVPAYNEAESLKAKIENSLALKYPADKLFLLFITDGTDDGSEQLLQNYNNYITHLHQNERLGKMAAINRAMQHVQTPVVIFSDANTVLNLDAVALIVKHYVHENIGGVAGEKKVEITEASDTLIGEGIYWQYESKMKQLDSDFNTVVGAAGELFSMRTNLFKPQKEDIILDDFILSLKICMRGYKVIYEPLAFAIETPSISLREESKRRIRISAGAFQSLFRLAGLFNFFRFPLLSFQYVSRRVFRWALSPLALILLYITNIVLVIKGDNSFYSVFFVLQNVAYAMAFAGWFFKSLRASILLFVPFYFVFMNASLVVGFFRYATGVQSAVWEKSKRTLS
ncbi:MAG TPA: glycosyltransferase family 2 protein [Segetibacter sp.]|jgi:cellulose synthase/poly-beta-1,6-N-acetylglucosamine synthase-like glycosyltransferase